MKFQFKLLLLWFFLYYFFLEGGLYQFIADGTIETFSFIDTTYSITSFIAFFLYWLISYTVLYKYYPARKWVIIIIGIVLSFIIPMLFRYLVEQKMFFFFTGHSNYPQTTAFKDYILDQYSFSMRYVPYGVIYYFIRYSFYNQNKESKLIIENQKMEMSLLRAQINPHFLLNSLNNIQSLMYMKSDKAIDTLSDLSDLLKYKLYQDKKWISIKEELDLIEKYIALEKLRFDYDLNLSIEIDESLKSQNIPQFLLLPIFENAFKHADLKNKENPFKLKITKTKNGLEIYTSNAIASQSKDAIGGIGLDNLNKRLALLYNNKHTFKLHSEKNQYSLNIILPTDD